jgi:hypothetical protein
VTTLAIETLTIGTVKSIGIGDNAATIRAMCFWRVSNFRGGANASWFWSAIASMRSTATRAAPSRPSERFRVVPERDLNDSRDGSLDPRDGSLEHLRREDLVRMVSLDGHHRGITLTDRGRDLLEANRRDRDDDRHQEFHAGISRPRELTHDAQLYRAYLMAEERLRAQHAEIQRVVLEQELKREYQCFLQEHNRGRSDSDGRPDRDQQEVQQWARDHDLPYFDDQVHFPDFRIEYELEGRERHEDIEVLTEHYRGAHAAARSRSGFTCYRVKGGGGGRGAGSFDQRLAEEFL